MSHVHRVRSTIGASATLAMLLASPALADDWGTLKGRFKFGGAVPTAAALKADKDVEVCGKEKLLNEELVVGADGGIANVVVFVRDKDVKVHPDAAAAKDPVLMDNKNCRFEPHVAFVQVGQTLTLKNSDSVGHNSNIATIKNSPSNSLIAAGNESDVTFKAEEAIPAQVTCNIHPWMKAWVLVRPNPYGAVSSADGSFEIKNLPAGDVELQLWHEKAGYIGEISVKGKSEKIAKGRKKIKVTAGDNDLGEMVLDANLFKK
jgi:plastocyanin